MWGTIAAFAIAAIFAAPPEMSTPALPVAPPPDEPRAARNGLPEILFVNFDGAVLQAGCGNDAHYDCSTLTNLFEGYVGPFVGNNNQKMAILESTRKAVADFGVRVVIDRPPDDVDYTMVLYGDLGQQSFAGIAPYIDCEDLRPGDTSFTRQFTSANTGSTVVLQEAAHTWGLEHVDSETDVLNPFKTAGRAQSFVDDCFRIVSNTELEPTAGSCNQIHTMFCESGFQNSYREMLHLFGPTVPDVTAPTLEITFPQDETTYVAPVTVVMRGDITDDLHPQFYNIQIFQDGQEIFQEEEPELDLLLTQPPPADYDLVVRITDEAGNFAEDRVRFTVLEEGSELPEEPVGSDDNGGGCRVGNTGGGPWWALLGLVIVLRRRVP